MKSGNRLIVPAGFYREIERHLLQNGEEQVAFIFAQFEVTDYGTTFRAEEHYLVPPQDLDVQLPYHVALTEEAQGRIIKAAWDRGAALIELHSHTNPDHEAGFSWSDLKGFKDFVPHVMWRLKSRPYMAIVVAHTGFDALVWRHNPDAPEALDSLEVGGEVRRPTGLTLETQEVDYVG
jgi:hypothetical protein